MLCNEPLGKEHNNAVLWGPGILLTPLTIPTVARSLSTMGRAIVEAGLPVLTLPPT